MLTFLRWLNESTRMLQQRRGIEELLAQRGSGGAPIPEDLTKGDLIRYSLESEHGKPAIVVGIEGNTKVIAKDLFNPNLKIVFPLVMLRQQPDSSLNREEIEMRRRHGGKKYWHAYRSDRQLSRFETKHIDDKRDMEDWLNDINKARVPAIDREPSALDNLLKGRDVASSHDDWPHD